jgi:hypothetical protein
MGRDGVGDLPEQRLAFGFATPEGEDADDPGVEVELGADEPVRPAWVDREAVAEP